MAYQDLFERLELKYLIDEVTAVAIRRAIVPHCDPDLFNGTVGRGYSIRSLYLDSPGLYCFRAKERGDHDRFKLRARVYDPHGQVHLEIKRKRGDVVWKERAAIPRERWAEAAQGWRTPPTKSPRALERFARLLTSLGAEPRMMVDYEREAYASHHDSYARVTFDRHVMAAATSEWDLSLPPSQLLPVKTANTLDMAYAVVLELKCEQLMPGWLLDVIHGFELNRVGFSKYNTAMRDDLMWMRARDIGFEEGEYA
jgi:hypothetical protein